MCLLFVLILIVNFSRLRGCCKCFQFLFRSLTTFLFPAGSKMRVCCSWWDCHHCPGNSTNYIIEDICLHGGFAKWNSLQDFEFAVCKLLVYWEWLDLFLYQRLQQELQTNPGSLPFDEVHLLFATENLFYITSVAGWIFPHQTNNLCESQRIRIIIYKGCRTVTTNTSKSVYRNYFSWKFPFKRVYICWLLNPN